MTTPQSSRLAAFVPVALMLALGTGCMTAQGNFFYPSREVPRHPRITCEDVTFPTTDGLRLHGWFLPSTDKAKATVVFCHGNAANLAYHLGAVLWLPAAGYNVLIFDYRGYGRSGGDRPTIRGVCEDSLAALRYVRTRSDVDPERLLVFGQSLGGAVSVYVVGKYAPPGVRGVLVDSAFSSYVRIAREKVQAASFFPIWLVAYLVLRDTYSPQRQVAEIAPTPVLFLHGDQDEVVPVHHSRLLFDQAGEPKAIHIFPGARHVESQATHQDEYRRLVLDFFARCLTAPSQ